MIDHARSKRAAKRGGDRMVVPLDDDVDRIDGSDVDQVAIDEAPHKLESLDPTRQAR